MVYLPWGKTVKGLKKIPIVRGVFQFMSDFNQQAMESLGALYLCRQTLSTAALDVRPPFLRTPLTCSLLRRLAGCTSICAPVAFSMLPAGGLLWRCFTEANLNSGVLVSCEGCCRAVLPALPKSSASLQACPAECDLGQDELAGN